MDEDQARHEQSRKNMIEALDGVGNAFIQGPTPSAIPPDIGAVLFLASMAREILERGPTAAATDSGAALLLVVIAREIMARPDPSFAKDMIATIMPVAMRNGVMMPPGVN